MKKTWVVCMGKRLFRRRISVALLAAALCSVLAGCYCPPPDTKPALQPVVVAPVHHARQYDCPRLAGPVTIDGKLTEDAWKKALRLDKFYKRDIVRGSSMGTTSPATTPAVVYLAWDDERLYFAAEIEDADVVAEVTGRDADLWVQDVIEIFLKPRSDKLHYYEFEFSPRGDILDIFWPARGRQTLRSRAPFEWNADVCAAALVQGTLNQWEDRDRGWTIEASIPFSAFAKTCPPPRPGDVWWFAVCKVDQSAYLERHENSATTTGLGFHEYESYDRLRFVGSKP